MDLGLVQRWLRWLRDGSGDIFRRVIDGSDIVNPLFLFDIVKKLVGDDWRYFKKI